MAITKPNVIEQYQELQQIVDRIPSDFGGGSPLSKTFLMSYIMLEFNLKYYVEIGVYKGRSFFPLAHTAKMLGGMAFGIDAYDSETAKEHDLEVEFRTQVNSFLEGLDFSRVYEEVLQLQQELNLTENSLILKEKSSEAVSYFRNKKIAIDMLHIDGNHDTKYVNEDVESYLPLVRNGGFIILDDVNWDSVRPVFNRLKKKYQVVFNNGQFSILYVAALPRKISVLQKHRFNILNSLVENVEQSNSQERAAIPDDHNVVKVSVVVITYNQEKYIAECLEGIFAQKGDFVIELIIGDDSSTDATVAIIKSYISNFCGDRIEAKVLTADSNVGMTKNLQRCFRACTGGYIAVCEGDDYWIDPYKLKKQVGFLKFHPECALCFHHVYAVFQDSGEFLTLESQMKLDTDILSTKDIVINYSIGKLSCCMYDARYMQKVPDSLFDLYIGDWMLNIYYSQFGDIGHLRDFMSVYRKHSQGVWSGRAQADQLLQLHTHISEYNKFLNYEFDTEFSQKQRDIELAYPGRIHKDPPEIVILDDVFPHPHSAFRMQEFICYLKEFENLKIYSSGLSLPALGTHSLEEILADFKRSHPEFASRVEVLQTNITINVKLIYMVFLGTAYQYIDLLTESRIPFVFTLYPGGWFGINNAKSDMMLRKVTSCPGFKKVIATQKITYDYLLEKRFCRPEQIEYIFGVVTPTEQIEAEYTGKSHFGIDKNTLDICFAAHKYTEKGTDKGYDIFIDVAKKLCKKYDNVRLHVVGGFDENVMDVSDIKERITFYGKRDIKWFDEFYRDKDIILSPNVPFMIFEGSFDGFPTGTCVDAGLRKTAMFCTDELNLNTHFKNGEEIVIIPHNAGQIVEIIEDYYKNPKKIKRIAENGCRRIKEVYSFEAQILPRINILKSELEQINSTKKIDFGVKQRRSNLPARQRLEQWIISLLMTAKRVCPSWIKNLFKYADRKIRSNQALFGFIKRHTPEFVIRAYLKLIGYL